MKDEARAASRGGSAGDSGAEENEAVRFEALEYHADDSVRPSNWAFRGSTTSGFVVERNGVEHLRLGAGYRPVETVACGVCSTDLARRFLPFPLPQITGHEVVVRDEHGRRFVVEINASHRARGVDACPWCRAGLATHCPDRLVLGIHGLPGGFGPRMLVPQHALLPIPDDLPTESAVLIEPFAAALHAVETVRPRAGEVVAVLGPRRLGLLVVAALRAWRERMAIDFEIVGITRNPRLPERVRALGADRVEMVEDRAAELADRTFDVVIDTTGNPAALPVALRLARREVHLKSTHGQSALGVTHWTELVVDELSLVGWSPAPESPAPDSDPVDGLPRPRQIVVDPSGIDSAIRPEAGVETAAVCPRGQILVRGIGGSPEQRPLLDALGVGVVLTSSRCGDFAPALELMTADARLARLGDAFLTHSFGAGALESALAAARTPECVKAVVRHV